LSGGEQTTCANEREGEQMGKVLRLGFAMGGGVSLGTFCGAGLTEAIKLLILFGKDADGNPYDSVKVDVFSGASAGAMSLGMMLKTLADPPPDHEARAIDNLDRLYGNVPEYTSLAKDDPKRKDLIAAQIAQDVQREVWVKSINIRALLGRTPKGKRDISCDPCLLDSGAVYDIAKSVMCLERPTSFPGRRVLADRALFCCTLGNLSPIVADARREIPGPQVGYIGLTDGMRSSVRRELRVFDLDFELVEADGGAASAETPSPAEMEALGVPLDADNGYPERWCRFQEEGGEVEGKVGDLTLPKTWARITATAVASGAFPFAFAPVVLTRKRYEFGERLWPKQLDEVGITDEYPFSYIDGGTFNNEPIREAFRLASYIDAQPTKREFERRILFVDPFVSDEQLSLRVPIHAANGLQEPANLQPFDGFDPIKLTSLDRLLPHIGAIVGALSDESRVIEADKIFQTRDRFLMRDSIRGFVGRALALEGVDKETYDGLRDFCGRLLATNRTEAMIPPGALTLEGELERVIREAPADDPIKALTGGAAKFLNSPDLPAADGKAPKGGWLRALTWTAVDLAMDLEGKSNESMLVSIAPFSQMDKYRERAEAYEAQLAQHVAARAANQPSEPPERPEGPAPVDLVGGPIFGFAGFMSETVRQHDFDAGILCAAEFLGACGLLAKPFKPPIELAPLDWARRPLIDELDEGVDGLAARVGEIIEQSHLLNLGWGISGLALGALAKVARGYLDSLKKLGQPSQSYVLKIHVPNADFNLDGEGAGNDITTEKDPVRGPFLTSYVTFHPNPTGGGLWQGPHVKAAPGVIDSGKGGGGGVGGRRDEVGMQIIPIDRGGMLRDRFAVSIRMPNASARKMANQYPNPVLRTTVDASMVGKEAVGVQWTVEPGVTPLEKMFMPTDA